MLQEKWQLQLPYSNIAAVGAPYMHKSSSFVNSIYVRGELMPEARLVQAIDCLQENSCLVTEGGEVLASTESNSTDGYFEPALLERKLILDFQVNRLVQVSDLFSTLGATIPQDIELLKPHQAELPTHVNALEAQNIYASTTARLGYNVVLDASTGPIYLAPESEVMHGAVIQGPFALGEHSAVKISTKIYGPTSIGSWSKVGGEINNCLIYGYSNKGHDGFLGNSVIGEWCNIGADTNSSNLKNNYAEVKLWDYSSSSFKGTGLQFCGLLMGDHSKCGINTMFNTGTTVGVSANIFGSGFPRTYVPNFAWGGAGGFSTYKIDKALETAERVLARRGMELSEQQKAVLTHIYEQEDTPKKI